MGIIFTDSLHMKKLLTLTQLAAYLGENKRTMYRMIQDKRFPVEPIKGTKPRRWCTEAVDQWVDGGRA